MKTYSELILLPRFEDRFEYCKLSGKVSTGSITSNRYIDQVFYRSPEWKRIRHEIIARDNGCDLAHSDRSIPGHVYIHHLNPITLEDLANRTNKLFDPENLICVSFDTHQAIHYGDANLLIPTEPLQRKPNDQCPWR